MKAREELDGSLILTFDSTGWTKWLFGAAGIFFAIAAYCHFTGAREGSWLIGLLVGAVVCILGGLAFLETACVSVDPAAKTITWNQRLAFWQRGGTLAFHDVRTVIIESPAGTQRVPSQRISLWLRNGTFVPLTYGSSPEVDGHITRAATLLRKVLGQPEKLTTSEAVMALVELGRFTDAVRLLAESEDLSFSDAKKKVEELKDSKQA